MYQTLYCFDFDDTLIHTMLPDPGMQIWEEKTGKPWPYIGWWSKFETLDMDIFDMSFDIDNMIDLESLFNDLGMSHTDLDPLIFDTE